ncbi:MAG TPA: LPS assembly lipoprotein LptE [Phycisphaerales bacterium]|nr:LPS assembly lipoprotein LptE [Phycisphaerales bacterium]
MRATIATALTVAVLTLPGATGCSSDPRQGYSFEPSFRNDVTTVSVPVWQNNTFYNGLEAKLAQALVTELSRSTPYKVTSSGNAGTVLEGTITSVELRDLSTGRETGLVQELSLEVVCDFAWKDTRSGKALAARRNFSAARSFVPANGARERIEIGENAAVQQLARDIVAEMRSGW